MRRDPELLKDIEKIRDYLEEHKSGELETYDGKLIKIDGAADVLDEAISYVDRVECFETTHDELEDNIEKRRGAGFEKVIFLDIDGVLNDDTGYGRKDRLYKEHLDRLGHIVDATGAVVVLTSTWRFYFGAYVNYIDGKDPMDDDVIAGARKAVETSKIYRKSDDALKLLDEFAKRGIRIVGRTESIDTGPCYRPGEVRHWLRDKPFVKSFAIIDDDLWPWGWMQRHVVYSFKKIEKRYGSGKTTYTDEIRGLTDENVEEAIRILNDYEAARDLDVRDVLEAAKGMDEKAAAEELCERFCVDLKTLKDKTAGKIALGERRRGFLRSLPSDNDYMYAAYLLLNEKYSEYDGEDYERHAFYSDMIKKVDSTRNGLKVRRSDIWKDEKIIDRYVDLKGVTVAIVCADVLTDEEVLTSSNIDSEKLSMIERIAKRTGCKIALCGKGLDGLSDFFEDVMYHKRPIISERDSAYKEERGKKRTLSEDARRSLSEDDAALLEVFMSRGMDVIGAPRYFSDERYDLPFSVREWSFAYPFMAGFVVLTRRDRAWGWMKENAVAGELTKESLSTAVSKLNSYSLNTQKDHSIYDEGWDRPDWIFVL